MKLEKWQGVVGQLVIDNDKAIIASDDEMKDVASLKGQVAENGKPVEEMRHKLLRDTMRKQTNVDVLKVKQHFEKSHDSENAEKVNNLNPGKPAQQFKQIKNEALFFGQSFLEGFLGVYGIEVDNAVERYENRLHVLETQDLDQGYPEKKYYIGRIKNGRSEIATSEIQSREVAEAELNKFYSKTPEQEQTQLQQSVGLQQHDKKEQVDE